MRKAAAWRERQQAAAANADAREDTDGDAVEKQ